ncbi:hypothetical protein CARUB_v10002718mg [Capsella rubella]|uniref:DUF295 domain-containing protein n=1 Tax=Capsella rubella TaxID=81985 RepID=R0FJ90_9BRAS|nr:hypothetical protein CARUB_v10002718mg [Capsella rubella]
MSLRRRLCHIFMGIQSGNWLTNRRYCIPYTRLASLSCPNPASQSIVNVSLSSSSPEDDDDCILAVKFLGPRFSFCRPTLGEQAKWTFVHIRQNQYNTSSSSIVYSSRHRNFYMTTQGSHYLAAWDLHTFRATSFMKALPNRFSRVNDFPGSASPAVVDFTDGGVGLLSVTESSCIS